MTDYGLKIIIGLIILITLIKYYGKYKVKNCFIGSCFYDKDLIINAQIAPKYLEGNYELLMNHFSVYLDCIHRLLQIRIFVL